MAPTGAAFRQREEVSVSLLKLLPVGVAAAALTSVALLAGAPVVNDAFHDPQLPRVGVPGTDLPALPGQSPAAGADAPGGGHLSRQGSAPAAPELPSLAPWQAQSIPDPALAFLTPSQRAAALAPQPTPVSVPTAVATLTPVPQPSPQPSAEPSPTAAPEPTSTSTTTPEPEPEPAQPDPAQEVARWVATQQLPVEATLVPVALPGDDPQLVALYRQVVGAVPVLGALVQVRSGQEGNQLVVSGTLSTAPVCACEVSTTAQQASASALEYLQANASPVDGASTWQAGSVQLWWSDPALQEQASVDAVGPHALPEPVSLGVVVVGAHTTSGDPVVPVEPAAPAVAVWHVPAVRQVPDGQGTLGQQREYVLVSATEQGSVVSSSVPLATPAVEPQPEQPPQTEPEPQPEPTQPTGPEPTQPPADPSEPSSAPQQPDPTPTPVSPDGTVGLPNADPTPEPDPEPVNDPFPIPVVEPNPRPEELEQFPTSGNGDQPLPNPVIVVVPAPIAPQPEPAPDPGQTLENPEPPVV